MRSVSRQPFASGLLVSHYCLTMSTPLPSAPVTTAADWVSATGSLGAFLVAALALVVSVWAIVEARRARRVTTRANTLMQAYQDPYWELDFDFSNANTYGYRSIQLALLNKSATPARDVRAEIISDPSGLVVPAREWTLIPGNGSVTWDMMSELPDPMDWSNSMYDQTFSSIPERRMTRITFTTPANETKTQEIELPVLGQRPSIPKPPEPN